MTLQKVAERLADNIVSGWATKPGGLKALREVIIREYIEMISLTDELDYE